MRPHRRHRSWIACIVSCTLLLAAFAAALPRPAARAALFAEVCGTGGVRLVRLDGVPDTPKDGAHHHCLYCQGGHTPDVAPPARHIVAPADAVTLAVRSSPDPVSLIAPPGAAWPRAPPPAPKYQA